ncbi:hypothetical protein WA538_003441 [Blastocystis sp. DL]
MSDVSIFSESIVDIMMEYFEVVIHQFLYYTTYYDSLTFDRTTKYGVTLYMNRVPEVILYVKELVKSVQPWMIRGEFRGLVVSIRTVEGKDVTSIVLCHSVSQLSNSSVIDYKRVEYKLRHYSSSWSRPYGILSSP